MAHPDYPEHAKLAAIQPMSQAIGEFLEASDYHLAEWVTFEGNDRETLVIVHKPMNEILADHFGIDLRVIEQEKRAMLNSQRDLNAAHEAAKGAS